MSELKDTLVELVEEYFPKGDKERGKATVMMSLFYAKMVEFLQAEALKIENHTHEQAFRCPKCVQYDLLKDLIRKI